MLYGSTGALSKHVMSEEEKANEKRERKTRRRNEIILTAIWHTLLLPVLVLLAICMVLYLAACNIGEYIKEWKRNGWKRHAAQEVEKFPSKPQLISGVLIECKKELPVRFDKFFVVYVETEYNEPLNRFIKEHIDDIRKEFAGKKKYSFVYIPELKNLTDEELALAFPLDAAMMTDETKMRLRNITTAEFTRLFADLTGWRLQENMAGLLRLGSYEGDWGLNTDVIDYSKSCYVFVDLYGIDACRLQDAFNEYFRFYCGERHAPFCVRPRDEYPLNDWQSHENNGYQMDASDYGFIDEQQTMSLIAEEIRQRVEILKQGGYIELLLHTLGADIVKQINDSRKTANKLVHITVDEKLRIRIPELNDREVKMPALSRALYVFYLRHTEGVEFKFLSEYTEEILALYRLASNRLNDSKLRSTVESLVNPTENKINECVSRIKSAFLVIMDEYLARNYFLQYRMGENLVPDSTDPNVVRIYKDMAKYVSLPREYVSYPPLLKDVPFVKGQTFDERSQREVEFEQRIRCMEGLTSSIIEFKSKKMNIMKGKRLQQLEAEQIEASKAVLEMDPMNFLAHFNLGEIYCNDLDFAKAISENTLLINHDAYTWNASFINRAEAYLYAGEYDNGLVDIESYFNSLRRWKEADIEAERIRKKLIKAKKA